jgi:hypothetical protein
MNVLLSELAARIRGELVDLDRVVERILQVWPQVQRPSEQQSVYVDSIALNLHSWYSGLERLFELIARHVDGVLPPGGTCIVSCLPRWPRIIERCGQRSSVRRMWRG